MFSSTRRLAVLAALPVCLLSAAVPAHAQAWEHGDGGRRDFGQGWRSGGGDEGRGRWDGYGRRAAYEPGYAPRRAYGYGGGYGYGGYRSYGGWGGPAYAPVAIVEPPPVEPVVVEQPPVIYPVPEPAPVAYAVPVPPVIVHHRVHHVAVRHCGCTCAPVR